jgi:hypothetical protein
MRRSAGVRAGVVLALAILTCTLWVGAAVGDVLQAGHAYAGGTRVESSSAGVSFVIPPGWTGTVNQDGEQPVLVLGSSATEGVGLVIVRTGLTPEQLVASLNEPQDLGGGVILRPSSQAIADGARIVARFENALYVGYAAALIGPDNHSVVLFYAGPQTNEATYRQLVAGLAKSVTFDSPSVTSPPPPADDPSTRGWAQLLSGQMLHYFSSYSSGSAGGGGMAAHRVLHLCADGRFTYFGDSMITMNVPGASASSGGRSGFQGHWTIDAATPGSAVLLLRGDDGRQLRWPVTYDGQKTFLNGQRWLRAASDACR